MDTQNLIYPPRAQSFAPGHHHHEQVLPMLGKPPVWETPSMAPTTTTTTAETVPATIGPSNPSPPISIASQEQNNVSVQGNLQHTASGSGSATTGTTNNHQNPNAVSKLRGKPRRATNAAGGGRSTLFWVHTDPQSASEGTREETLKRIRSHVMSEHNRKKRESTKRHSTKTWKHLAFQPVETTATAAANNTVTTTTTTTTTTPASTKSTSASAGPSARPLSTQSAASVRSKNLTAVAKSPKTEERAGKQKRDKLVTDVIIDPQAESSVDAVAPAHETAVIAASQPWTYLGQGSHDPFSVTHTPLSDRMCRHLQYFLGSLTRQAYPLQHRSGPELETHWASLVQKDPASLHASICVAASSTALQTGEFPLIDPTKQTSSVLVLDTFHHRGETIRLVNEGLSDPIKAASDELIAAVSILLTIEIASGNPDYLKIHLAGLRQMISLRNNFVDVPPDVRFQISWTDIRVACMAFSKPIFPFIRSARPSSFSVMPPHEEHSVLASRLTSLIEIPGIFDEVMCRTIYDLRELTWYAEWVKGDFGSQQQLNNLFSQEAEGYFNNEVLHVEYSLHKDRYTETGLAKGDASTEGCVRLACILFHNTAIWDFIPSMAPVFPKPIIGLRQALEATISAGCYGLCRDLLIWLLFIGACSSPLLPSERTFFVNGLATALRLQGVHSWQELRALLMQFFYVDRKYLLPLRTLWEEISAVGRMSYD